MKFMTKIKNYEINTPQTIPVLAVCFVDIVGSAALLINAKSYINIFTIL